MGKRGGGDIATFFRLIRAVWVYRWMVILTLIASLGSGVAVIGKAPLIIPLIDKIFPAEEFGREGVGFGGLDSALGPAVKPAGGPSSEASGDEGAAPAFVERGDSIPRQLFALFRGSERVRPEDRKFYLVVIAVIGALLGIVGAASTYGYLVIGRWVQFRVLNDIRIEVYRHLLTLSLKFFQRQRGGDLLSRLTNDLLLTERILNFIIVEMMNHPARILVGLVTLLLTSWKLTLVTVVLLPLFVLPLFQLGRRVFRAAKKRQVKQADVTEAMMQTFSGIRVIQAFQMEEEETDRFEEKNEEFLRKAVRVEGAKATARGLMELLYSLTVAGMVLVGGFLILDGAVSLGRMMAFFAVIGFLYPSFKSLSKVFNQIQECLAGTERVFQLFEERAEVTDRPGAAVLPRPRSSIAFDAVEFAYDAEPVLRGVSFEVPVGKIVAVVGPSGAGKSTMLDLVARFYDPTAGRVLVDGADVRAFSRESLLAHLAVVTQDPFLFNTTVRENIRFAKPDATQPEIEAATRAADIHDFILTLPEGYETNVGERGALLSGGQRQRITIARAILRNPAILLLDEATSSLDTESEAQVQKALRSLMVGRTTFVIAHRLSTVQDADWILVLDRGRLVEEGTHETLLQRRGVYSNLYQIQFSEGRGPDPGAAGPRS